MLMHEMRDTIVAIDPGEGTGIAWSPIGRAADIAGQIEWAEVYDTTTEYYAERIQWSVMRTLSFIQRSHARVVVVEDNGPLVVSPMMRGRLTKDSLIPVRFEAMLSFALAQKWSDIEYIRQGPSDKNVMTNARLQRLGCLPPSKNPHARDAVRHLIVALDRRGKRRARTR